MRNKQVPEETKTIEMIKTPAKWPMLALPLKRRVNGVLELGFVMFSKGTYTLYLGNIYDIESHKLMIQSVTAEKLVELGWQVD